MSEIKVYSDFSMGMNDTVAPDKLSEKEFRKAFNIDLSERGGFSKRKGTEKVNATSFNGEIDQYIEWFAKGNVKKLIVMNNKLYKYEDTLTELKTLNSSPIGYFFMKDKLYFTDGAGYYYIDETMAVKTVTPNTASDNDLAPIKKCKYFVWHSTSLRIFASGNPDDPTALYFSESNQPDYFKKTSIVYPANSEGAITGLTTLQRDILVSYNNSWWHWIGTNPQSDAVWEMLPIPMGCVSNRSIALTPNSFTFLANDGIYQINAGILYQDVVVVKGDEMITNLTDGRMENTIKSITNKSKAIGVFHDNKYKLAFTDVEGEARNNKILVFNWSNKGFTVDTGIQSNDLIASTDNNLYIASKNYLLKESDLYSDVDVETGNKKAIAFEIETKDYHLDYPLQLKFLKEIYLMFKQQQATQSSLNVSLKCDYVNFERDEIKEYDQVDLIESFIWGAEWGTKKFGYVDYIQKKIVVNKMARRFKMTLTNSILDDTVTCYSIGFNFNALNNTGNDFIQDEGVLLK